MPIIKSAKKRVKTANKAAVRNSKTKRSLKGALKIFAKKATPKSHSAAQSNVDKAVKKGVMHKNKAARLKKQLAAKAKADGVKHTGTKKAAAKPAVKKAAPAKKAAAKAPAKKPAVKKAPAKKAAPKKK
jgi:ribosomal protein S20